MACQRVIVMGTGPFAVPTFRALHASSVDVLVLVTRPGAGRGRRKPPPNPMREAAVEVGIEIIEPPDVNHETAVKQLASLRPDLLVVCDYGQILRHATLGVAPLGGINLHGSLLPSLRGAAPVNWAILNGDRETGISVIHMTPKLDAGPCLVQRTTPIGAQETAPELEERLSLLGVEPVMQALPMLATWDGKSPLGTPQDAASASRAPRLSKENGQVDWARSAEEIGNQVRGLKPWPGTYTYFFHAGGEPLRVILDAVSAQPPTESGRAGDVVVCERNRLLVAAGQGCVAIERIQPAGKRVMAIDEFLRGHPLVPGDHCGRLESP
jgi:methionyl-tRNA formyltransferase